jgi:hypothetical protein
MNTKKLTSSQQDFLKTKKEELQNERKNLKKTYYEKSYSLLLADIELTLSKQNVGNC